MPSHPYRRTSPRSVRNCAATQYMEQVRGLAPKTREGALRLVEALLRKHFGDDPIQFEVVTPERVRRFFAAQAKNYKTPSSLGVVVSSLRSYFRWRATQGDRTHALVGALAYPANWQLASLPKSLEPAEVEQLEAALGQNGPSMLRADAMVRCMLDLGLRSGEVAWTTSTGMPARSPCAGPRAGVKT
jgi:integrase/recombinase XerC